MTTIAIAANDQDLIITQKPLLASGDKDSVLLHVDFSTEWDGYSKTAIFYQSVNNVYHAVLDMNNECLIPWEALASEGTMYFGIYGVKDDERKTSEVITYKIAKGAWSDETNPSDPTPDVYTQLLTICAEARTAAEGVAAKADQALAAVNGRAVPSIAFSLEIQAVSWADNYAEVLFTTPSVEDKNLVVTPAPESYSAWVKAGVYAVSQTAYGMGFECVATPDEDLTANILIVG